MKYNKSSVSTRLRIKLELVYGSAKDNAALQSIDNAPA